MMKNIVEEDSLVNHVGETKDYGALSPAYTPNATDGNPEMRFIRRPTVEGGSGGATTAGGTITPLYEKQLPPHAISRASNMLVLAAFVSFAFTIGYFVGAWIARSMCLLVHSLVFGCIYARVLLLLFLVHSSGSCASRLGTFRVHKWDLFLSMAFLFIVFFIFGQASYVAFQRAVWQIGSVKSPLAMLITAGAGLIYATLILFLFTLVYRSTKNPKAETVNHSRLTSEGFGYGAEALAYARERGLLLRRTFSHVEADPQFFIVIWFFLQTLVAFAAAILVYLEIEADLLDAVLTFCFAPLVVVNVISIVRDALEVLMEGVLRGLNFTEVAEALLSIDGVVAVRQLRIWALSADKASLSVTLAIDDFSRSREVYFLATDILKHHFKIDHQVVDITTEADGTQSPRYYNAIVIT